MIKKIIFSFLLLFLSINVLAQNDTLSKKELRKQKKALKKKAIINDSILLSNNDLLVGEIKKMDKSVITFKTKYSDSDFKIKWQQVVNIKSDRVFIIAMNDGQRLNSSINTVENNNNKVILESGVNSFEEDLIDIIYLEPIGRNLFSRLTIDIDFGITLAKANNFKQFTSNISGAFLANKWKSNGYFKTVLSHQDGSNDINRMDGEISGNYFLRNDWFLQLGGIYLSNDEQKLKLRSTYKAGAGYYFIHNNRMAFGAGAGLAWTNENYIDDTSTKKSGEIYLAVGVNKYDIGDLSLMSSAIFYPSITEKGRYRADVNMELKYDLPLDLYIKMSLTYNWDNQPIEGTTPSDYVFTTSFGWEFN